MPVTAEVHWFSGAFLGLDFVALTMMFCTNEPELTAGQSRAAVAEHMASDAHGRDCYTNTKNGKPITEHQQASISSAMAVCVASRKRSRTEKQAFSC
jgi:hypothetical protein